MIKSDNLHKWLIGIAIVAILFVCTVNYAYFSNFPGNFSIKNEDWGTFGDFLGGSLNPILSFLSLLALLMTLSLQNKELKATREELELSRKEIEASRIAQQAQATTMSQQAKLNEAKEKRDATFQMLDRWTSEHMRKLRVSGFDGLNIYLGKEYTELSKLRNKADAGGTLTRKEEKTKHRLELTSSAQLHLMSLENEDLDTYKSLIEVCQFMSDLIKLIRLERLDNVMVKSLFDDSIMPWFHFIDTVDLNVKSEINQEFNSVNTQFKRWWKNEVLGCRDWFLSQGES